MSEIESEEDEEPEEEPEDEEEEDSEPEGAVQDASTATKSMHSATLDTKARLAANLLLLNGPEWGHVVSIVEFESPKSLVEGDTPGFVELNLDDMDPTVFSKITSYAEDKASSRKRPVGDLPINDITGKKKRRR